MPRWKPVSRTTDTWSLVLRSQRCGNRLGSIAVALRQAYPTVELPSSPRAAGDRSTPVRVGLARLQGVPRPERPKQRESLLSWLE